jgi:hypothetical protein
MKQLLLEIDEITEAKINAAAKTAGLSTQQWVQKIIEEKTATTWPNSIKALAGDMARRGFCRGVTCCGRTRDFTGRFLSFY